MRMSPEEYERLMKLRQKERESIASAADEAKRRNALRLAAAATERGRAAADRVNNPPPFEEIQFTVPGKPFPWQRSGHFGNTHYTPKKMAAHQDVVRSHAQLAGARKMDGPLDMRIVFVFAPPPSWSQKKQGTALAGGLWPTGKPDLDNLVKQIKDALNGVLYEDDAQIVSLYASKGFAADPLTRIWVKTFRGQDESATS